MYAAYLNLIEPWWIQIVKAIVIFGVIFAVLPIIIVYERKLRPAEKLHQPWMDRVQGQLAAAYSALECEIAAEPLPASEETMTQAGVSTAVAWAFTQLLTPDAISPTGFPVLAAYSAQAERLPVFVGAPMV